ncbi:MAG: sugar phosphate isomerase/epimerase [Burkholderiaceae bacterium]|nr:sugar phosphate isomerase/epimerase [Burkholderiaceae bacterium]
MNTTQALPISIQLYSLRNIEGLDQQLDVVQAAGYRHVELIGSHLDDAANTKAALDQRGLKVSSGHVSMAALRERPDAILAACKLLGFDLLLMPVVPVPERESGADYWLALGRELGALSQKFKQQGITLGYHNHHWELLVKEGGKTALELLFEGAAQTEGGSPLVWQVDVAWLVRGGVDPAEWLNRYRDRVVSVHAKDLAPSGEKLDEDGWADVGSGVLDWHRLVRVCREAGAQWLVAEHDKPNDPVRFTRASYAFLNSL